MGIWDDFREYLFDDFGNETGDGGEGEMDALAATLGDFYTDDSLVPVAAQVRSNGLFRHIEDAVQYLERGGLVFRKPDGTFAPNPVVVISKVNFSNGGGNYQIYIYPETP